jgi:hypothetical protein
MMLDRLHNDLNVRRAISPTTVATGDAAMQSQIIDLQNRFALEFLIAIGTIADNDATFTILVEDGDDSGLSDNAAVADAYLLGTESGAGFTFANDDEVRKIGYIGPKRYVRLTITPASNTGQFELSAIAVLMASRKRPHSSQDS